MRAPLLLVSLLGLAACYGDETLRAYGGGERTWLVTELGGQPFTARATLRFPEEGRIAGDAPCNSYSADMAVPYPWFRAGPIAATRRACPDLAAESAFLAALAAAAQSEVLGNVMILSDETGVLMELKAGG